MNSVTHLWAVVIFKKLIRDKEHYLVVENTKSGNITFPSWAKEPEDVSVLATGYREITEELGEGLEYELHDSWNSYEFEFWKNKPERYGDKWKYSILTGDGEKIPEEIPPTKDVKRAKWLTAEKVVQVLSFPDLVEVFQKTINI